jgi:hypothetical protein
VTGPTQNITPRNGQITFSPKSRRRRRRRVQRLRARTATGRCGLTSLTFNDVVLHIQQPPGTDVLTFSFGTIDP